MANLLKIAPRIESTTESVHIFSVKCRHFNSVAKHNKKCRHMKKCQYLGATAIFFECCKGPNLALNDLQPPPTARTTSRPLNTSLQQHLEGEELDYNMD